MCRDLRADEIDVRVQSIREDKDKNVIGAILLLYKNARVDMDILDAEYGRFGWQRTHEFKNGILYCTVSVWDNEKQQWISREDCGTESNSDAEKGQASDSFKRANVNFGIGRELYTSPNIYIGADDFKHYKNNKGFNQTSDRFSVTDIDIKDKQIVGLVIKNDSMKKIVYTFGTLYGKGTQNQGNNLTVIPPQDRKPTQPKNEPKTSPNEPTTQFTPVIQMTYEEALNYMIDCKLHFGKTLKDVYKTDRQSIQNIYNMGSTKLKRAIEIIEAEILKSKKQ